MTKQHYNGTKVRTATATKTAAAAAAARSRSNYGAAAAASPTANLSQATVKPDGSLVRPAAGINGYDPTAIGNVLLGDPTYMSAQDNAVRTKGLADGQYLFDTNSLATDYGYTADGSIDVNNPYSRAALLQETYRRARLGNTNSYAAQGQLYSGALQTAQDESTRGYNIGDDQLKKGYARGVGQAGQNKLSAYGSADSGVTTAAGVALANKLGG